uniref:Uncharacterized protein n=1 Tax=Branchiostoma floridae TaxID=7739 RepID=C3XTE1_BRAFL|eukprot:XP_002612721.1 hypothetical protein BRAFLDRAFT_99516 [Branchiostoma floridae]
MTSAALNALSPWTVGDQVRKGRALACQRKIALSGEDVEPHLHEMDEHITKYGSHVIWLNSCLSLEASDDVTTCRHNEDEVELRLMKKDGEAPGNRSQSLTLPRNLP